LTPDTAFTLILDAMQRFINIESQNLKFAWSLEGVENMRKILATIVSLLMATSFSTLATAPIQAYISTYSWIGPIYHGSDQYYGTSVAAYEAGSTAQLLVTVYNDWYGYANITVTAVKVWFDWNVNYSSTETPFVMKLYESHNFMINFTVPSTDVATNLLPHNFRIYVEFSYDTYSNYWSYYSSEYFAVYSTDQAEAQGLYQRLEVFRYTYPLFITSQARASWFKGQMEFLVGETSYGHGNFTDAKTHYQTAWNSYNQAVDSEADKGTTLEDALTNLMNSTGQSYTKLADLKDPLADGFLILSVGIFVGMILIGIGVTIYALAKRKTAAATATTH
jgi:hypothetical protein